MGPVLSRRARSAGRGLGRCREHDVHVCRPFSARACAREVVGLVPGTEGAPRAFTLPGYPWPPMGARRSRVTNNERTRPLEDCRSFCAHPFNQRDRERVSVPENRYGLTLSLKPGRCRSWSGLTGRGPTRARARHLCCGGRRQSGAPRSRRSSGVPGSQGVVSRSTNGHERAASGLTHA